jgi:hypothetical protein
MNEGGQGWPEAAGAALAAERNGAAERGAVERSDASAVTAVGLRSDAAGSPSRCGLRRGAAVWPRPVPAGEPGFRAALPRAGERPHTEVRAGLRSRDSAAGLSAQR